MKKRNIIVLVTLLCCYTTLSAGTWRVNNSPSVNADFNDLETALESDKVLAGDTLYVEGSPYDYAINDIVKKVTLIGPGYYLTENPNTQENKAEATIKPQSGQSLYILAEGTVCEGLTFASSNVYLYIGADNVTLRKCWSNSTTFIEWASKTSGIQAIRNTVITQCMVGSIQGNNNNGYYDYSDGAHITNNIITSGGISNLYNAIIEYNTCIGMGGGTYKSIYNVDGSGSIRHNIIRYELSASDIGTMTQENNYVFETADFVSNSTSSDGQYQLATTSALKTNGPDGKEVGAFGGSSPYILSGLPNVPHIYEIIAPTSASAASGLDVTVKIATEK